MFESQEAKNIIRQIEELGEPIDIFSQQYDLLRRVGATPAFLHRYGFSQRLPCQLKEGEVLALEYSPTLALRRNISGSLEINDETLHLIFLPADKDISSLSIIIEQLQKMFKDRVISYFMHRSGFLGDRKIYCNCSGGEELHIHMVVLPSNIQFGRIVKSYFDVFLQDIIKELNKEGPANLLFDENIEVSYLDYKQPLQDTIIENPGYTLGFIAPNGFFYGRNYYANIPVDLISGLMRRILGMLVYSNDLELQKLSHHNYLLNYIDSNPDLLESLKMRMLEVKKQFYDYFES